ncbi:hypothetical protein AFM11_05190 [Mycolicibacterium wolinskyi]|uniref:Uncharacterized protein n=1 Tax=Mycolicibacterium wolinskyi TaxID=59750 RepID=A0A132PTJ1_9MYCO|nr:hypothetical protein AFM11_05190 [Mycolicibacterium wolinskyi]
MAGGEGKRRATLPPDDPRHGTTNGYGNLYCRCDRCREANRLSHSAYMKRLRDDGRIVGKHGTDLAYDSGCRCDTCREAHNTKSREYKRRRRNS